MCSFAAGLNCFDNIHFICFEPVQIFSKSFKSNNIARGESYLKVNNATCSPKHP